MGFDVKHTGNTSSRDGNLVKLISLPAIRASSLEKSKHKSCSTGF